MSSSRRSSIVAVLASLTLHAGLFGAIVWWRASTPPTIAIGGSGQGSADSELPGDAGEASPPPAAPLIEGEASAAPSGDSMIGVGPNEEPIALADVWKDSPGEIDSTHSGDGAVGMPASDSALPRAKTSSQAESHGQGGAGGGEPVPAAGNVPPVYPQEAKRQRIEGTVHVALTIKASGDVSDVEVAESSGHSILDEAAVKGVRKWRFTPATVDGVAVAVRKVVPINFILQISSARASRYDRDDG